MKVLFIGGTGNISASVSTLAVDRGIDLYHLNRGITAHRQGVSGRSDSGSPSGTTSIAGDINKPDEIARALKDHTWDAVVNWIAFREEDVRRDFDLFRDRTKQYIFISSASVYQKPLRHPVITESTPLGNPYWRYSRDKIACELLLNEYHRDTGFPVTIVRPSHTYDRILPVPIGGGSEYTAIDRIKRGKKIIVHGDGTSLWTLTHSEDFAKGFVGLLGQQQAIGHAFHITSDERLTWDQIHHTIADAIGCEADIVHIPSDLLAAYDENLRGGLIGDKAVNALFDNSKIKQFVPDFTATIPFSNGIRRTLDWFHADPARQIVRPETNQWIDTVIDRYLKAFPSIQH
jgi:nucleoside-diphosphate-sugar epimerase